jgi:hypothetical protein
VLTTRTVLLVRPGSFGLWVGASHMGETGAEFQDCGLKKLARLGGRACEDSGEPCSGS